MSEFDYADEMKWPTARLTEHYAELAELDLIPHGEERKTALAHEMGCVLFELMARGVLSEQS